MDDTLPDRSYEESRSETREYQELLSEFLRDDLTALIQRGDLDGIILERLETLAREGQLGPEFEKPARGHHPSSGTSARRGRRTRGARGLLALVVLSAAILTAWYIGQRGAEDPISQGVGEGSSSEMEASTGSPERRPTVPGGSQEPTLAAVLARVDTMLAQGPTGFNDLSNALQGSMLGGALEQWRAGSATRSDLGRIRRAMAQTIVNQDFQPLSMIDGEYDRDCIGESCPAMREYWRDRSAERPGRYPPFPGQISADSMLLRLEEFEKALIADHLDLWEKAGGG